MPNYRHQVTVLDACIKCSACTSQCPVANVNPGFPGPKAIGPDAERFRLEGVDMDAKCLEYCSNCKTCEVTCPSGVNITGIIRQARQKAKKKAGKRSLKVEDVRNLVLGRAEYLGKLGSLAPGLTNAVLSLKTVRKMMESTLAIGSEAVLPKYTRKLKHVSYQGARGQKVLYFPGCFTTYNDELTGKAVIAVLEHLGYEVIVPNFHCCGIPLESNGFFQQAEENAKYNMALMAPYLKEGIPIITSCTSCGLTLKEDYAQYNFEGGKRVGAQAYDFFEFLWELHERGELNEKFLPVSASLGYHTPCHLRAQGIGLPSNRILRLIPGVKVQELDAGCCGLSGSYGFKAEKYDVARKIGQHLFERAGEGHKQGEFQQIITECGGCKVQIEQGSGVKTFHPVWVLVEAYGLQIK